MQPGNDYWVGSGTWTCVRPFTEWVLNRRYDPADGEPDTSAEGVVASARSAIGDPDVPIRPDRHIAWRSADRPDDPAEALRSALRHVLALKGASI